ncbi:hypothetical protein FB45DRAFT_885794 [Roridomyces roridus]|uniref:Uncharacterized protein n=1 Tax=Roridomyces roridus TaxID=1738132 RepID=A0AAD7CI47_9AGAR|nr:hypothetical protein FB45DRAFT_885794 [Roridomyces roridus]
MDVPQSLASIATQIARDLDLRHASISRLVWSDIGSIHRCPGYVREEVTLATRTADSAVVSHDAPTIQEVCSVCREVVNLGDVFRCVCGHEGPGSHPTLKCRSCKLWSHRDCGPIPNESICSFCVFSASGIPLRSEHLPVHKQDVNFLAGSADEVGSAAKTFFSSPVSAKRARPLQREAKEKEFAEGQHANVIDGVWHCSNCGSPESIAVRRRKGPLGDEAQCGTCGLWEIRQFRPMEYNLDYDFHWQAGGPQKEVEDVLPDEYNAPSPSTPNTMTFPITAAYFERVFYWDGCGNTQYGTVQQVVVQANGTVMLQILLDIGGTVILPRTCTRTTMSVNLSKGSLNPTVLVTAPAGSLGFEPRLSLPASLPLPHISLSTLAQASGSHQSLSHRRARRRGAPRRF